MSGMIVITSAAGVLDDLAAAAGLSGAVRLGSGGVAFSGAPADFESARAALADKGVDVNFVADADPSAPAPRKLLIADMDSTIITCECIDEIADFAGVKPRVAEITERAMRGELDFEEALRERVGLLEGLTAEKLQDVYDERVSLSAGARVLARTMTKLGADTALVSGGFDFFANRVADAAGFNHRQANILTMQDGKLDGGVRSPILGREAKAEALARFCAELGVGPTKAIAVGDGANDLAMLGAAGLGVAYKAKPIVAEQADTQLNNSDLTALLYLQGVREADFIHD